MDKIKPLSNEKPVNPANKSDAVPAAQRRIPMSVPQQKLEAPQIPGYHLHWMRGTKQRIAQAQRAGYEFVTDEELASYGGLNSLDIGGGDEVALGSDMGTRVSVVSGEEFGPDGQAERLYLMKIREEWWKESQAVLQERNDSIARAIRGGTIGSEKESADDAAQRYGGQQLPAEPLVGIRKPGKPANLFTRKS